MALLVLLGLIFITFSYIYPFTPSVSADILPAFVGFLLLWYAGEKLSGKTKWFKEVSVSAAVMAAIHFIGFASCFRGLLPQNTTFADSDIFRFMFTGIGYVYENGALIFTALGFISVQFLCRAFGNIAEEAENRPMTVIFYIFSLIFIVLTPVYIVFTFITLPFNIAYIGNAVTVVFMLISLIFMKKYQLD